MIDIFATIHKQGDFLSWRNLEEETDKDFYLYYFTIV